MMRKISVAALLVLALTLVAAVFLSMGTAAPTQADEPCYGGSYGTVGCNGHFHKRPQFDTCTDSLGDYCYQCEYTCAGYNDMCWEYQDGTVEYCGGCQPGNCEPFHDY
ncbi:MAG: hypothetical protein ACLF0P_07935 [Thermoanaerobaculia bacterium]